MPVGPIKVAAVADVALVGGFGHIGIRGCSVVVEVRLWDRGLEQFDRVAGWVIDQDEALRVDRAD